MVHAINTGRDAVALVAGDHVGGASAAAAAAAGPAGGTIDKTILLRRLPAVYPLFSAVFHMLRAFIHSGAVGVA